MTLQTVPGAGRSRFALALGVALLATSSALAQAVGDNAADAASPWGMAAGAGSMGYYPRFTPILHEAGVTWLRIFPEWQTIQPRQGQWNWEVSDRLVADARAGKVQILGLWCYFAPWASADGGTRKGPIKDMQYWRDYVRATVSRYHKDIKYWEVWNEFDGSFYEGRLGQNKSRTMPTSWWRRMTRRRRSTRTSRSAPASADGFLDLAIKAGAADHFDFVACTPTPTWARWPRAGSRATWAWRPTSADARRQQAAGRHPDLDHRIRPGAPVKADPRRDAHQADCWSRPISSRSPRALNAYSGSRPAGGFGRWRPHRLRHHPFRLDAAPRVSGPEDDDELLGKQPHYVGWLDMGTGGYGFVFRRQEKDVLAAWAPAGKPHPAAFASAVQVTDTGRHGVVATGPGDLVARRHPGIRQPGTGRSCHQAQANRTQAVSLGRRLRPGQGRHLHSRLHQHRRWTEAGPRGHDHSGEQRTAWRKLPPHRLQPGATTKATMCISRVDPQFVPYGTRELEITIVARRLAPDKQAGMSSATSRSRRDTAMAEGWTIPAADHWHEHTWKLSDANFVSEWGWNFRFDAIGSPNEFLIKKVRVTKTAPGR